MTFVICYDVSSNTRRARLARILEKYGERVQLSVFKVSLRMTALDGFKHKLLKCLKEEDELLVLPLCSQCYASALRVGAPADLLCVA